jgi:WD40 repeat protein
VRLWEVGLGKEVAVLRGHDAPIPNLRFSPDGKWLASAGFTDENVRVWDVYGGRLISTLAGHSNWVMSVEFSPDGKTLASGSNDGTIKLWGLSQGN